MRPLTAINLIILGSCSAIAFSLAAVLIVVLVLGDEYPRLQNEFEPLLKSLLVFVGMTTLAAASFYGLVRDLRLRFWLQGAMWLGLAGTAWFYWP
jgi:TctA family transporter